MISDIHFPTKLASTIDGIDVAQFLEHVLTNPNFQKKFDKMSVVSKRVENNPLNKLMITVVIRFQMWEKKELGTGAIFEWTSYRAVDHSCSNRDVKEIKRPVIA